jgi:tRNA U55 pseudouridine synthase TruB
MYSQHMKKRVIIEKAVGETPLAALKKWKEEHPQYKDLPASYAGRLDPMASGKLLILLGEECKKQKAYTKLDKEYEIEILLDVGSDTGDALGLIEYVKKDSKFEDSNLAKILEAERGAHMRRYPQFSSKTVHGKPLFLYALDGSLGSITIPEHEERIDRIVVQKFEKISSELLRVRIQDFLSKVPRTDEPSKQLGADFRIDSVRASWETALQEAGEREFSVLSLRVVCGSGTYMRSLAPRLGAALGTRALALSIHRSKMGMFWWSWWIKTF